jgi:uncharacterized protein (TIGR00369 family)
VSDWLRGFSLDRAASGSGASFLAERKHLGPLIDLNRLIKENRVHDYPSANLALGMVPLEFGPGTSRWTWNTQPPEALNPFQTLQGGYLSIFVDELFSTAIASVLEDGEWAVTAEFKITFLRALRPGPLHGSARVLRRSRALAFLEGQVTAEGGAIAVAASSTWAISR